MSQENVLFFFVCAFFFDYELWDRMFTNYAVLDYLLKVPNVS